MKAQAETILDVFSEHAQRFPNAIAFRFLPKGDDESTTITFEQLYVASRAIAAGLLQQEAPGTRLVICLDSGLDFIKAFLGCMFASMVPVPVDLPRPGRPSDRLRSIISHSQAAAYITGTTELDRIQRLSETTPELSRLPRYISDDLVSTAEGGSLPDTYSEREPAFIQYTSGSTSHPKGVLINHRNLISNQRQIQAAFGHGADTRFVGWLPMFHDMGLVGNVFQPLFLGIECTLMPPAAFVQRPVRWLKAISRYRATTSGGPNFGFDHCVRRISDQDVQNLDISSWRVAFNGAEPVRETTLSKFAAKFEHVGFSATSWLPCYGLAEATLFVSSCRYDAPPNVLTVNRNALLKGSVEPSLESLQSTTSRLVSSGRTAVLQEVKIVHPDEGRLLAEGRIGEIWVSGPNVASQYFGDNSETDNAFRKRLIGDEREYLSTGDLGFMLHGELYVTGRRKDLIIIRGRNVYPHDVETLVAQANAFFQAHKSAAFSVEINGEESLVVVQEVMRNRPHEEWGDAITAARAGVVHHFEIDPYDIVLVSPGNVPITSSGKIRRRDARTAYLEGELAILASLRQELLIAENAVSSPYM